MNPLTERRLLTVMAIMASIVSCRNNTQDETKNGLFAFEQKPFVNTSWVGKWHYSFPFYSSELIILQDSTFKFHEQSCLGHSYSEGQWTVNGQSIFLTSYEKYREENRIEPEIEITIDSTDTLSNAEHIQAGSYDCFNLSGQVRIKNNQFTNLYSDTTNIFLKTCNF